MGQDWNLTDVIFICGSWKNFQLKLSQFFLALKTVPESISDSPAWFPKMATLHKWIFSTKDWKSCHVALQSMLSGDYQILLAENYGFELHDRKSIF